MKNRAGKLSMGQGGNKLIAGLIAALIALTILPTRFYYRPQACPTESLS